MPEINLAEEEYIKYSIDEIKEEVIIHFKESDVIMGLMDFNKLIEERMDKIGVIDEEIIHGNIIDLTENSYSKYKIWDKYDSMYLYFGEGIIEIDKRDFNRLKEDIIEQEDGLIREGDVTGIELSFTEPSKRSLLKAILFNIIYPACAGVVVFMLIQHLL